MYVCTVCNFVPIALSLPFPYLFTSCGFILNIPLLRNFENDKHSNEKNSNSRRFHHSIIEMNLFLLRNFLLCLQFPYKSYGFKFSNSFFCHRTLFPTFPKHVLCSLVPRPGPKCDIVFIGFRHIGMTILFFVIYHLFVLCEILGFQNINLHIQLR